MKGIILAGGRGTRLAPLTDAVCKQLLPVYDKPMIYYPIDTLVDAGIKDVLIISTPQDTPILKRVISRASRWPGVNFSFRIQVEPRGLAEAFIIGENFIAGGRCALILGDNIFLGTNLNRHTAQAMARTDGATIFARSVNDPGSYGVVEIDQSGKIVSLAEKPKRPASNLAVLGLYFYDESVVEIAKSITPSARGELEITDVNKCYLERGHLSLELLDASFSWFDAGTPEILFEANRTARGFILGNTDKRTRSLLG